MHLGGDFGMGFGFGGIFMILFWVLIILGVVYLEKMLLGSGPATEKNKTAQMEMWKTGKSSRQQLPR